MTTLSIGTKVINATNDIYTVVSVMPLDLEDNQILGLHDPSDNTIMTDPKWYNLNAMYEDIKEDITIYTEPTVLSKQEQFDNLYLTDSNTNLNEVNLTDSKISANEFLDASINKMVDSGMNKHEIYKAMVEALNNTMF